MAEWDAWKPFMFLAEQTEHIAMAAFKIAMDRAVHVVFKSVSSSVLGDRS